MSVAWISHPRCAAHDMGAGHPEQPGRIAAVEQGLRDAGLDGQMQRIEARWAHRAQITRAHTPALIGQIESCIPAGDGIVRLDADTALNAHSLDAALYAAGAASQAVEWVLGGEARAAFCAVRPPGHHAERATAMGFCLFNNVAIAALHALEVCGLERVAIIDFDVHFGNGTDDILANDARVLMCQSYQFPLYPLDREAPGHGNTAYFALPPGSDGEALRQGVESVWRPALQAHAPQLVLFSAGFDAHADDPLAQLNWREADYDWVTRRVLEVTGVSAVVSTLEGGYDLAALGRSAAAHVGALLG